MEGRIADVKKDQEHYLRDILLAESKFAEAQSLITLGLMTADAMHPVANLNVPILQNITQGLETLNQATPDSNRTANQQEINAVKVAFSTSIQRTGDISATFMDATSLFSRLAGQAALYDKIMADKLKTYTTDKQELKAKSNVILWVNSVILLIQLFFSTFYDMFTEKKQTTTQTPAQGN